MSELGPMSTGGNQNRAPPSPLPDLRRRPSWSPYTGLQDPVVTGAARSSSDPTTTAAWYVTIVPIIQAIITLATSRVIERWIWNRAINQLYQTQTNKRQPHMQKLHQIQTNKRQPQMQQLHQTQTNKRQPRCNSYIKYKLTNVSSYSIATSNTNYQTLATDTIATSNTN